MRLLLVDDSQAIRQRLSALLEEAGGVIVAAAGDGAEALRLVRETAPDVIVLDLKMPKMGGLELLHALRSASVTSRVVVLTNHANERYRAECLRLGADAFLDKSGDLERIIPVVTGRDGGSP